MSQDKRKYHEGLHDAFIDAVEAHAKEDAMSDKQRAEEAKQKVREIYPDSIFYRGVGGFDSVILNTNKRPWLNISEPNNCGDADAAWIDAASRLPVEGETQETSGEDELPPMDVTDFEKRSAFQERFKADELNPERKYLLLVLETVIAERICRTRHLRSALASLRKVEAERDYERKLSKNYLENLTASYGHHAACESANKELQKRVAELEVSPSAPPVSGESGWHKGHPDRIYGSEWFIAITTYGDRVVLQQLPEEYAYDYETADGLYIKADKIYKWMQFPDSDFIPVTPAPAPDMSEDERVVRSYWFGVSVGEMGSIFVEWIGKPLWFAADWKHAAALTREQAKTQSTKAFRLAPAPQGEDEMELHKQAVWVRDHISAFGKSSNFPVVVSRLSRALGGAR